MAPTLWLGEERGRRCDESWLRRAGGGVNGTSPPPQRAPGVAAAEVGAAADPGVGGSEAAADPGVGEEEVAAAAAARRRW
jgi:hypothetical protein